MSAEIVVNWPGSRDSNYLTWTPALCGIRSTDGVARSVRLRNEDPNNGGQLVFLQSLTSPPSETVDVNLPAGNQFVGFFAAGRFDQTLGQGFPSSTDGDASIDVTDLANGVSEHVEPVMVRIRKNANDLTAEERDRFLSALVTLNQRGDFADFQNMHTSDTSRELHGRSCFLPWHRLYLLDLERKLQAIDPGVVLPYWRFDQPAPNVFTEDFVGVPDASGLVQFSNTNPLVNWRLTVFGEGSGRVRREFQRKPDGTSFDPTTEGALIQNDEAGTLNLGTTASGTNFMNFERMESDPHGAAHVSFRGQISDIGRAPADPLFFMLHCNVDRLWAKWQWSRDRFDATMTETYYKQ